MPQGARAQGQVCAQHPTTANPTRQQGLSNGGHPFHDAPHPFHDTPHPPPESPNLAGEFLGRLGVPRGLRVGAPIDCNTLLVPPDARSAPPHSSHTHAYWITSSARNSTIGGIVSPRA